MVSTNKTLTGLIAPIGRAIPKPRWGRYTFERLGLIAASVGRSRATVERKIEQAIVAIERKESKSNTFLKLVQFSALSVALGSVPAFIISLYNSSGEQLIHDIKMAAYMFVGGLLTRFFAEAGNKNDPTVKAYRTILIEERVRKDLQK